MNKSELDDYDKGQIISECPFEILDFPKIVREDFNIEAAAYYVFSNTKK